MRSTIMTVCLLLLGFGGIASAQIPIDTFAVSAAGDTVRFWAQIPAVYSPDRPPALLIWWHQLGGTQFEMLNYTNFPVLGNERGWITASHLGPSDRHWNTEQAQEHCRTMMDWLAERYPFSRDSIYMVGGSMGGAAGQVWHNNHCGIHDYLIAATAGGSQILDTQLRQEQYLALGDTNRSMRADFGGLPCDTCTTVNFEYHRASAIFIADTSQCMLANSLRLPEYNTWGSTDAEWEAYGYEAQHWDSLRRALGADTTVTFCSGIANHGLYVMDHAAICDWLAGFSARPYPEWISINADQSDEYYWTRVTLADTNHTFGRYGVSRNFDHRTLDMTLVHNIAALDIECSFPWPRWDSLICRVTNLDSAAIPIVNVRLYRIPQVAWIRDANGNGLNYIYSHDTLTVPLAGSRTFVVSFDVGNDPTSFPAKFDLVSAYPNPFNSDVNLVIECNQSATRDLLIYDLLGRLAHSEPVHLRPGTQQVTLAAKGLGSGVYFVRLSESGAAPLKIVLMK